MKYLIVNGDDFGAGHEINRGIIEAHRDGILSSTSFMVDMPGAEEAALLSRAWPALGVGLHVDLVVPRSESLAALGDDECRAELHRQFRRFQELMGRPPTHIDSHHNVHLDPRLLPHFLELAGHHGLPLRGYSPARYFPSFYGQWDGQTHLEQISVDSLLGMLKTEVREGFTELSCHPGYVDVDQQSGYAIEREAELRTLCDPSIREALAEQQIRLVSFGEIADLIASLKV